MSSQAFPDDSEAVLAALLERMLADRDRGGVREVKHYLVSFPGHEELVAREYERLMRRQDTTGAAVAASARVARYRLLRELGRGGQAAVHLAVDEELGRKVALKVLALADATPADGIARLRREAAICARLAHPSICAVHDFGHDGTSFWIAMQLVDGESLARRMARVSAQSGTPCAPIPELVAMFAQIARALHVAHEAGIVHRDVKPGNIMVTPEGRPVILDFGLAVDLHSQSMALTRSGDRFGTPAYMSPEQLAGDRALVDRRTDVWSAGVSLYEAVTTGRPFQGPTADAIEREIRSRDPASARRHNRAVSRDLALVLQKALEKDPRRRYATALDFALDLERVAANLPVTARPIGGVRRAARWVGRHPFAASLMVVLAAAFATSTLLLHRSAVSERRARAYALAAEARRALESDPPLALHLALAAVAAEHNAVTMSEVHHALDAMHQVHQFEHGGMVVSVVCSPDGGALLSASSAGTAKLWSLRDPDAAPRVFQHDGAVNSAVFAANGETIVTASNDGTAAVWPLDGSPARTFPHPNGVLTAELSADGTTLLTGCRDGEVRLWDVATHRPRTVAKLDGPANALFTGDGMRIVAWPWTFHFRRAFHDHAARLLTADGQPLNTLRHDGQIVRCASSPTGDLVVTASRDQTARLWDARTGAPVTPPMPHDGDVGGCVFSPDGACVITASDRSARLWRRDGTLVRELHGHAEPVSGAAFSADGKLLLTTSGDQRPRVWTSTGREVAVLRGHRDRHTCWAGGFVPGTTPPRVFTGAEDGTVRLWQVWPDAPAFATIADDLSTGAFAADGSLIVTATRDGRVHGVTADGGEAFATFPAHASAVIGMAVSTRPLRVATVGADYIARVWDPGHSAPLREIVLDGALNGVAMHPNGQFVALASGGVGRLVGLATGAEVRLTCEEGANSIAFSRDGELVLTTHHDATTRLWDLRGRLSMCFAGHAGRVWTAALAPDDRHVVTGGEDGRLLLWARDGELSRAITTSGSGVKTVAFSPRGDRLVTSHIDHAARLWDLDGNLLAVWRHPYGMFVAFLADGRHVLTASPGGTHVWHAYDDALLAQARSRDRHALSPEELARYATLLAVQAPAADPELPVTVPALRTRADALWRRADRAGAIECCRRAVGLRPRSGDALAQLLRMLAADGRAAEAKQLLAAAADRSDRDERFWNAFAWGCVTPTALPPAWTDDGVIAVARRTDALARRTATALSDDLRNDIRHTLAAVLHHAGRVAEAEPLLAELVAVRRASGAPPHALELAYLAMAQHALGRGEDAQQTLAAARAVPAASTNQLIEAVLAEAAAELARPPRAR
jgi:WD40 repeat protein